MREFSERTKLILWDTTLIIGVVLLAFKFIPEHYMLIVGFTTAMILSNCVRNHIAAYKLNGKIY